MRRGAALIGLIALASAGCASAGCAKPRDQHVVTISTDAPVPALGDRLLIEVDDGKGKACSACRRLVDASHADDWPISFGIDPGEGAKRVRARLLRSAILGSPDTAAGGLLLDGAVLLPEAVGITEVSLRLSMGCFGVPADLEAGVACDPDKDGLAPISTGREAAPLEVGSWEHAGATPCNGAPPDGMVCIPGAAFILGDAASPALSSQDDATIPEHLVLVSPFFLDRMEITVAEARALLDAHPEIAKPAAPGAAGVDASAFCTFAASSDGALPVSCLDHATAAALCEARGARLPTEAEWELAAGNGARETAFPWGEGSDVCDYAIVERGDTTLPSGCRITDQGTLPAGPVAGGSPADRTDLGIQDLGGSVAEWVADSFERYDEGCWATPGLLMDPLCATQKPDAVARGASFADLGSYARAVRRRGVPKSGRSARIGVRCAKDAR